MQWLIPGRVSSQWLAMRDLQLVMSSGLRFQNPVARVGLWLVAGREQNKYLKALAFGKTKEVVHVDMAAKMEEAGLAALFPMVSWPETRAVLAYVLSWSCMCCSLDVIGRWRR